MRQIVLDTETTGLEYEAGHRIIEVGCVELVNRRLTRNDLHLYINPEREIDEGAQAVHGITLESLADKPRFAEIASSLQEYLGDAELIIHNAPFDLGFLNHEFKLCDADATPLETRCSVIDTLVDARQKHPGQRNSLDALCKRYFIDNSQRELHGALLDAQLLAEVYLGMTGGQGVIELDSASEAANAAAVVGLEERFRQLGGRPKVLQASDEEAAAHAAYLQRLEKSSEGRCLWSALDQQPHQA